MSPWDVLGISRDADKREIKRAYSKLIKEHRPDDSPEQFQLIRSAYETMLENLSDSTDQPALMPTPALESTDKPTANPVPAIVPTATPATTTFSANSQPESNSTSDTIDANTPANAGTTTTSELDAQPAEEHEDLNRDVAVHADAFIKSFQQLIANFPDNGKLTPRDMELCRHDTVSLMRSEVLNHWHARAYLSDAVFQSLCDKIAIATGLFSTTTNFPSQFLQYLDDHFQWTENEVELCEQCEDDSAGLVFHSIHDGKKNNLPKWIDLPEPSSEGLPAETGSGTSLGQKSLLYYKEMNPVNLALLSNLETEAGAEVIDYLVNANHLTNCNAAFIASEPDTNHYFLHKAQDFYNRIGINLSVYFDFESGYSDSQFEMLLTMPLVHLSGGNTYRFLHAIRSRSAEAKLQQYAKSNGIIVGVSAGAMLLTPSIESATLCGDANRVQIADTRALGLTEFLFAPHATKTPDEIETAQCIVKASHTPLYLCNDEDSLIISGTGVTPFGNPVKLEYSEL